MADAKYVVEYARSAKSVCKSTTCEDKNINDGELRLGKLTNSNRAGTTAYNTTEKMMPNWYHPKCMFEMLKKAQKSTKMLFSGQDFHFGWDQIQAEDKQLLQTMMDQLKIDRDTPKTKKRPISDDKVKTPAKRQKTHHENNNHSIVLVEDNWSQILSFVPSHDLFTNVLYVSKTFYRLAAQQICQKGLFFSTNFTAEPPKWLTDLTSIEIANCRSGQGMLSSLTNLTSYKVMNSTSNVAMRKHLQQCTKLRELYISSCTIARGKPDITTIAASITSLTTLSINSSQSLALGDSVPLKEWTNTYGALTHLKRLDLVYMGDFLYNNPTDTWTNLTNLETLRIWNQTTLNQQWLDVFARMTGLRHLLLDLDYVVHEGHMPREAIDLTPFTNLTKLTLCGTRSAWPKAWPVNLKEIDVNLFVTHFQSVPNKHLFEHVKFSNLDMYTIRRFKNDGVVLPKGSVKVISITEKNKVSMDEILELDPECLEITITSVDTDSVDTLTTLFGDMSRLPKKIRLYLQDGYKRPKKKYAQAKEAIDRLLVQLQDKAQLFF